MLFSSERRARPGGGGRHVRADPRHREELLYPEPGQDRAGAAERHRCVSHRQRKRQGRGPEGPPAAGRPGLAPHRHLQHPLQRRPHRREQVSPGTDRVRGVRPGHRVRLHPASGAGASLPVRRLSVSGPAAQVPDGPGERRPAPDPGRPARGVPAHPAAGAFLRHGGLPHPGRCGLSGRLPLQPGDPGQVPDRLCVRRGRLSGHPGTGEGDGGPDVHSHPRPGGGGCGRAGPVQHRQGVGDRRAHPGAVRDANGVRDHPAKAVPAVSADHEL